MFCYQCFIWKQILMPRIWFFILIHEWEAFVCIWQKQIWNCVSPLFQTFKILNTIFKLSFYYVCVCVCVCVSVTQSCLTFCDPTNYPRDSPGKNTGVDCHSVLQRIFLTQGSDPGLLNCRQILYHLSYREDLRYTIVMEISLNKWHFKLVVHSFVEKKD